MRARDAFPHAPQGLYDPRHEHDACGVAFVATLTGEPSHDIVAKALTALRNLDHRGAAGAEVNSGDGAGHPDPGPRRVPARGGRLRAAAAAASYAVGTAFLAADAEDAAKTRPRIEEIAAEEGLRGPRLARRAGRPGPARRHRPRRDADLQPAVRGRRRARGCSGMAPRAAGVLPAQARRAARPTSTSRRCRRAPWSTRACSPPTSSTTSSPTWSTSGSPRRWPSCTRASPPTPSRAGRWPTRSATSPTTARSTP